MNSGKISEQQEMEILAAYNDYCAREFDEDGFSDFADICKDGKIGVAYDGKIEVAYDIERKVYTHKLTSGKTIEQPASIEQFISDLRLCDFSDFVRYDN